MEADYTPFITAAWAVAGICMAGLSLWIFIGRRSAVRRLAELKANRTA